MTNINLKDVMKIVHLKDYSVTEIDLQSVYNYPINPRGSKI